MKNYNDFTLDMIFESLSTEDVSPLLFSKRFETLLNSINHPISYHIIGKKYQKGFKTIYIDLDDSGLDKVSYILSNKAIELILDKRPIENTDLTKLLNDDFIKTDMSKIYKNSLRTSTTIGRLIKKMFKDKFVSGGQPGEDIESFTKKFKSNRKPKDVIQVTGEDITKYYHHETYLSNRGELGSSCMKHDRCIPYISFYQNIPNVSLLIIKDEKQTDKIIGRALLWKLVYPENRYFMDRVYTIEPYDVEHFIRYATENKYLYKHRQNSDIEEPIVDTITGISKNMELIVGYVPTNDTYPFLDTLSYYSPELKSLSNTYNHFEDDGVDIWELSSTGGGYDILKTKRIWVDYYNGDYEENDLEWCELGQSYRLPDDAHYINFYMEFAAIDHINTQMKECDYANEKYNYHNYREHGDYVILNNGEISCIKYADNYLTYSDFYDSHLPPLTDVWSEYHNSYLYRPESTEVFMDVEQSYTDWRCDDDGSWWTWENEHYDDSITEEELIKYHSEE